MAMTRIGILGATGRMGRAIADATTSMGATIAGGIGRDGAVQGEHGDLQALALASDVLVDFTRPDALAAHLEAATRANCPIVIGTTGLSPDDHALIDKAATRIALVQAANTSLGVNLLRHLVKEAAARLGPDWDIEVLEMHHRHKVDAPSGTALLLASSAAQGRGSTLQALSRFDRISEHPPEHAQAREEGTIGYAALRGGSVAGDHMVIFAGDSERIELGHRAENRGIFARGAVKAALWLRGKEPGRYDMNDVLGL